MRVMSLVLEEDTANKPNMKGNKMNYMEIETVSLVNFASILMYGIVKYDMICYNSKVSDVTLDGKNINDYLPKEYHHADGTVHVQEPSEGNLIGLLAASDGKVVAIYNHDGEVFRFTIEDGLVHYTSYKIFEDIWKEWAKENGLILIRLSSGQCNSPKTEAAWKAFRAATKLAHGKSNWWRECQPTKDVKWKWKPSL